MVQLATRTNSRLGRLDSRQIACLRIASSIPTPKFFPRFASRLTPHSGPAAPALPDFPKIENRQEVLQTLARFNAKGSSVLAYRLAFYLPVSMNSPLSTAEWNALADQSLAGDVISREAAHRVLAAPDTELLAQLQATPDGQIGRAHV